MRKRPAVPKSAHQGVEHAVHAAQAAQHGTQRATAQLAGQIHHTYDEVKPRLRGWLHAVTSPLTLAAGIVLIALSPDAVTRIGSAVFTLTAVLLFTVSAIYHRGTWSPRTWAFLRRFDHANIFLLIAGSYTPFTLLLLEGRTRTLLLSVVWGGAALGVLFRVFWPDAPRWLYTPIYIGLGWAAIFFADEFAGAGPVVLSCWSPAGCSTRWAASSTGSSARTRPRSGSASTRCSTP